MRITESIMANSVLANLQAGQARLEKLQQEVSTGKRISAPGDDPVSAQQVLQLKGRLADSDQYARNITVGNAWLAQTDSSLNDAGNVMTRAREIAMEMANGTYDASGRASAASEVKQLKSQLVQIGNSQVGGRYIFGGFVSDRPPFDTTPINNPADPLDGTPTGTFVGTDDPVTMEVDRGAYVAVNTSGAKVLRGGTPPGSSGVDLIGELDKLATALSTNDVSGIQATLPALDDAQNQILAARADVGARMSRVQTTSDNLDNAKVSMNKVVSDREDVDFLQVVSDLSSQQNAFQAALAASAKTSQLSLLDYLK